jgi:hypothetical protein
MTKTKLEEEIKNGTGKNESGSGTTKGNGNTGTGNSGDEGRDTGNGGGQVGGNGHETGQSGNENSGSGEDHKQSIINKLKRKRNERTVGNDDNKHKTDEGRPERNEHFNGGTSTGIESFGGIDTRPTDEFNGTGGELAINGGNSDGDNPNSETVGNRKRKRKIKGVEFELPSFETVKPVPPIDIKEQQLGDELTQKESKDLKPRLEEAMKVLFKGMDKTMELTTKRIPNGGINIWKNIEDEEVSIIANALLEAGQNSKVVSTITRRVIADYSKLQIGIILLPRFIDTYSNYMTHGFGFGFTNTNGIGGQ